jgi:hypothetical protein
MRQDTNKQAETPPISLLESLPTVEDFKGHQVTEDTELLKLLTDYFGPEIHFTRVGVASATNIGEQQGITRSRMRTLGYRDFLTKDFPEKIQRALPSSTEIMVIRKDLLAKIHEEEIKDAQTRMDPKVNAGANFDPDMIQLTYAPAADPGGAVRIGVLDQ